MIVLFLSLVTTACVLLTVSLLGSLRTLAGLQLRIQGRGDEPTSAMRLDYGRSLPDRLLEVLPGKNGYGAVAFLAPDCEQCWSLASELRHFNECPLVACVIGADEGDAQGLATRLGRTATVASMADTKEIVAEMRILATPVVVFHRDGFIVGSATGNGARSIADIQKLWKEVAPDADRGQNGSNAG